MPRKRQTAEPARPFKQLGDELKRLMARERMTQADLAAAMGSSISYPSKILDGQRKPSYQRLVAMCDALRGDIDRLAHLAGYNDHPATGRPDIAGWDQLTEEDQAYIRTLVARMARLNEEARRGRP